jgi:pyridoxine/pyridoxamine 5'-phosphate oxidase
VKGAVPGRARVRLRAAPTARVSAEEAARRIVDANRYMTLATADVTGLPWASPVWFATSDYREFFWVSSPDARHSRNIAVRPEIGIVIFDSRVEPGSAGALYMAADAEQLEDDEATRGIEIFSSRSVAQGLAAWSMDDVGPTARHRPFRARTREHYLLGEHDDRVAVRL